MPHVLKDENLVDVVEASAMVASHGRGGGHNNKGGGSGRKDAVEKSAEELDKELETYHAEAMNIS